MRICGYESKTKFEVCTLPAGHEQRHFDFGEDQKPMLFSVKAYEDNQRKLHERKTKPAKHVHGFGRCHKFCN